MKLTIHPTSQIADLGGVRVRVWEGVSEDGTPVTLFVARLAIDVEHDQEPFMRELESCPEPRTVWPSRMIP